MPCTVIATVTAPLMWITLVRERITGEHRELRRSRMDQQLAITERFRSRPATLDHGEPARDRTV